MNPNYLPMMESGYHSVGTAMFEEADLVGMTFSTWRPRAVIHLVRMGRHVKLVSRFRNRAHMNSALEELQNILNGNRSRAAGLTPVKDVPRVPPTRIA